MIVGKETATHYTWGDKCDGWPLVQGEDLLVVEERMPPGTAEILSRPRATVLLRSLRFPDDGSGRAGLRDLALSWGRDRAGHAAPRAQR